MVATPLSETATDAAIIYPSSDGEPLAETSVHVDAIINIVVILRQLLQDQQAIVLADQFFVLCPGLAPLAGRP